MRIRSCVSCGSRDLDFMPGNGMSASTRFGVGPIAGIALCRSCGKFGGPIEFESEKEYNAFLEHLAARKDKFSQKFGRIGSGKFQYKRKKGKNAKEGYKKRG